MLICAALSDGISEISNITFSKDIYATINALESSGAKIKIDGNTVTDPQGTLYMTANSASGSKYYELLSTQQDYIAARSQNWLPSYSVITMTADSFSIDTYQITDDGKAEAIDDTFTIQKSGTDTSADTTDAAETESDTSAN